MPVPRKTRLFHLLLLVLLVSACSFFADPVVTPPLPQNGTTLPGILTPEPRLSRSSVFLVQISVSINRSAASSPELEAGSSSEIRLNFTPTEIAVFRDSTGKEVYTTSQAWENHPVREMQACLSLEKPCDPSGKWDPLQPSISQSIMLDWLGPRTYYLAATFRDANGAVIPSVHSGYKYSSAKELTRYQNTITSVLNPATPVAQQIPPIRTAVAATQKAFPVTGSVKIENGRSAAGGTAGKPITLKVQYSASSPAGKITQMRTQPTSSCRQPNLTVSWEPFAAEKSFTTTLALNWVGFYVAAQFQDEKGNLSPIFCDDISLEGSPARTP